MKVQKRKNTMRCLDCENCVVKERKCVFEDSSKKIKQSILEECDLFEFRKCDCSFYKERKTQNE